MEQQGMEYTSAQQYAGKIHRLSERMLLAAKQSHWQAVTELESERQQVIDALFQHPEIAACLDKLADTLYAVMVLDRECIMLGEQAKLQSGNSLSSMQHSKKAVMAYLEQSR